MAPGFGSRGIEGKIKAIKCAREKNIPFFGICLGMQMAVIEFSRNVLGLNKANSTEMDENTPHPVISLMENQKNITEYDNFKLAALIGSISPIKSATVTSGVANFSKNLSSL